MDVIGMGSKKNVCVVGLGDVGRSPRFQYHCISFAKEGFNVDIVGYKGAKPKAELLNDENVRIIYLPPVPEVFNKYLPRILSYILKVIWQSITLFFALLLKRRSHYVFVQTPPAIPAFAIVWFYCCLAAASFIIDWHNYAYSIMALTLGERNTIVRISYWFECYFGKKATSNICVTKAMQLDLMKRWAITSKVVYDRPHEEFGRTPIHTQHQLFTRLSHRYPVLGGPAHSTAFTTIKDGKIILRPDRPALLISCTSWTEDEDFNILLSALIEYDKADLEIPKLICAITGRGPLKDHYIGIIQATKWSRVSIITPWLEEEDYPLLLGCANLGVSLHTSSSGLDLPMKVVDMFGSGIPVLAHDFKCINELVRHGENGLIFKDASELSSQLIDWFTDFPNDKHSKFEKHIQNFQALRWHHNWCQSALTLFK